MTTSHDDLHQLVDALPPEALESAREMLEFLAHKHGAKTAPPKPAQTQPSPVATLQPGVLDAAFLARADGNMSPLSLRLPDALINAIEDRAQTLAQDPDIVARYGRVDWSTTARHLIAETLMTGTDAPYTPRRASDCTTRVLSTPSRMRAELNLSLESLRFQPGIHARAGIATAARHLLEVALNNAPLCVFTVTPGVAGSVEIRPNSRTSRANLERLLDSAGVEEAPPKSVRLNADVLTSIPLQARFSVLRAFKIPPGLTGTYRYRFVHPDGSLCTEL